MILQAALPAYQATVARHTMSVRTLIRPTDKSVSLKWIINGDRLRCCLQSHTVFCLTLKLLIVPLVEIISLEAYRLIMFLPNVKAWRLKSNGWKHFYVLFQGFTVYFFNSIIDKHQHTHFFTFKTVLI